MNFQEETLMAYVDGELDAATRGAVEAAMASDPQVAAAVARQRDLQAQLRAAFGGVVDETVPARLIAAARASPAGTSASVSGIAAARDARQASAQRKWSLPEWSAIAASLLLGVIVSRVALHGGAENSVIAKDGRMIAGGTLAAALNTQPAGAAADSAVQVVATFRAKSGGYCRTFTTGESAGLACRSTDDWSVRALAPTENAAANGDYRMAATPLPPAIAQAVAATIDGAAFDAEQETAVRERGWE